MPPELLIFSKVAKNYNSGVKFPNFFFQTIEGKWSDCGYLFKKLTCRWTR